MRSTPLLLLHLAAVQAYNNGVARTPPMGWSSWCTDSICNAFGKDPCSEHMVKTTADAMVKEGMLELGYNYVTVDDCWSATTRDENGNLRADAKAFPSGIKSLADYVHAKGLSLGLYTCVGTKTCKGDRPGSYGHYEQDARTLASWGVDFIKMDHCGLSGIQASDKEMYGNMSRALNATGRPITFSLCQWGDDEVWKWGAGVAQMFRVQMDHLPLWWLPTTSSGAGVGQGTLQVIEWMAQLRPSNWTRQYGWLDPDFLMTLYWPTMDYVASRSEYTFWCLWSSPLLVSTDVRHMTADMRSILMNPEAVAINQDESFTSGDRLRKDLNGGQLWARPLANGDKAIVLFHGAISSDAKPVNVTCRWVELGWPSSARVSVRDVWERQEYGTFEGSFTAEYLAPRDVRFLRLRRQLQG
jgi:alpha-galactosidase